MNYKIFLEVCGKCFKYDQQEQFFSEKCFVKWRIKDERLTSG